MLHTLGHILIFRFLSCDPEMGSNIMESWLWCQFCMTFRLLGWHYLSHNLEERKIQKRVAQFKVSALALDQREKSRQYNALNDLKFPWLHLSKWTHSSKWSNHSRILPPAWIVQNPQSAPCPRDGKFPSVSRVWLMMMNVIVHLFRTLGHRDRDEYAFGVRKRPDLQCRRIWFPVDSLGGGCTEMPRVGVGMFRCL